MYPTKQSLIDRINLIFKIKGSKKASWLIDYHFTSEGYYLDDKRKSRLKFAIEVVDNCYDENLEYSVLGSISEESNKSILNAIKNCEE